ncbi:unnamed protein product [Rotaria sp. Silwood2]|nr:unnamed protein product [Rotaria sp. Silwood2]CAF4154149.1 unnamed protein product [Rotaria sp. Silwood2]
MKDAGSFPITWFANGLSLREIQPWFPLPSNLINKGEEWIPEIQGYAIYESPKICNLKKSGIGQVSCLSYFETPNKPVKTIQAHASQEAFDVLE